MALNIEDLLSKMLEAAKDDLKKKWPKVAPIAKEQFIGLSRIFVNIENDKMKGAIKEDEAKELMEMHRNAVKGALKTVEGIGAILAESAINAALGAVKSVVNTAIGWRLIP
ncbi:MAG: hypothetical protein MUP27_07880 [Desulfobacterales bacterium]|nr:hypothetical protein [Desulfobacterales bacterium]